MSYSPINVNMYLAAYAGALSGMNASGRVPTNASALTYVQFAAIAGAWAQSFDAAWNSAEPANVLQEQLAQRLSGDTWLNRAPQPADFTLDSATYDSLTASLVAMITASDTYMTSEGIVVPPGGGSGGGNVVTTDVNYQMLVSDTLVEVDTTLSDVTVTLPENAVEGSVYSIAFKTIGFSNPTYPNIVNVSAPAGGSIVGANQIYAQGAGLQFVKTANTNEFQCLDPFAGRVNLLAPNNQTDTFSVGWLMGSTGSYLDIASGGTITGSVRLPRYGGQSGTGIHAPALAAAEVELIDLVTGTDTVQVGGAGATGVRLVSGANYFELPMTTAAGATAGASGAPPAQVAGYITVVINGTTRKIPFYAN